MSGTDQGPATVPPATTTLRCLIVEKHPTETSDSRHQIQIPLSVADEFFGPSSVPIELVFNVYNPHNATTASPKDVSLSPEYEPSSTRRINQLVELGDEPSVYVFIQETSQQGTYEVWWRSDKSVVESTYSGWKRGRDNQYGPGRRYLIIQGTVPR